MVVTITDVSGRPELRHGKDIVPINAGTRAQVRAILALPGPKLFANERRILPHLARLGLACPGAIDMEIFAADRGASSTGGSHDSLLVDYGRLKSISPIRRTITTCYDHRRDELLTVLTVASLFLALRGPMTLATLADEISTTGQTMAVLDQLVKIGLLTLDPATSMVSIV